MSWEETGLSLKYRYFYELGRDGIVAEVHCLADHDCQTDF